jgi:hypothetical protein
LKTLEKTEVKRLDSELKIIIKTMMLSKSRDKLTRSGKMLSADRD